MRPGLSPTDEHGFVSSKERAALLEVYARIDELVEAIACDASTDCCHFERTGKEPWVTPLEWAEARLAARRAGLTFARGGGRGANDRSVRGRLPLADEGRCPFLSSEGRCRIYASRPIGCRTFFCERATGIAPRREVAELLRDVVSHSERLFVRGGESRPLRSWVRG